MEHYITSEGRHFSVDESGKKGWEWEEGAEVAMRFFLEGREAVGLRRGPFNIEAYANLPQSEPALVQLVEKEGRGYGGGHKTAARLGWEVTYPKPEAGAVLWWDTTTQGRFTGFRPATTSLILA